MGIPIVPSSASRTHEVENSRKTHQEVEHGEELARRHEHVVTEPARDDGVVHDWFVRLVLEVGLPATLEVGSRPCAHFSKLFLGRTNLNAGLDTVGGQRPSALDVPLLVDSSLHLRVAANEVIKGLNVGLSTVHGKHEVVVLEVQTDTRQVDQGADTGAAQLLRVANTGALKNLGRPQGASTDDDLLAGLVDCAWRSAAANVFRRHGDHTDGTAVLDDNLVDLGVALEMQVGVLGTGGVDVSMRSIASTARVAVDPLEPVLSTVARLQVLKVVSDWNALRLGGTQKVLHDWICVVAKRDLDRPLEAVDFGVVAGPLVCLVLLHKRDELLGGPALGLPVIVVRSRRTSVHLTPSLAGNT